MSKDFKYVPVFTKDSVVTTKDEKKKQAIIDEWTDELAVTMAGKTNVIVTEDGVMIERHLQRGGHNRQIIEMLDNDGYVVKVFHSIIEAAKFFGVSHETVNRELMGKRNEPLKPGYTLRRRETEQQRKKREKTAAKAEKTRKKNIAKKNKTKNKRNYGKE